MKALWIGVGIGPETYKNILANRGKILSGYVSQTNIIEGFDALNINMDSINASQIAEETIQNITRETWSRNGQSVDVCVGYRNVRYLNRLFKQRVLCKEARRWARKYKNEEHVVVFVYSMHAPFMAAAKAVKRIIPHAHICLLVLDLPQYMDLGMSKVKKVLKTLDWFRIQHLEKSVDRYVLYAKPMADFLKLKDGTWMVMEGSYDSAQQADALTEQPEKKTIMYSGVLDLRYGIPELLDAMKLLDDSYELWLTGSGNAAELIKERAAEDSRIVFYGYLPSRQDLLNKQAVATMLINPRRDIEEASQYCFPSKLFEYMASGRPVISCRLAGIPEEYYQYLYCLPHVSAEEIAQTVKMVANEPEEVLQGKGEAAKTFILSEKNKYVQAEKIATFMNLQ